MPKKPVSTASDHIDVSPVLLGEARLHIIGLSPFIFNAVSEKARHELLLPKGRKNEAEKASSLKHDPINEYRNSTYRMLGEASETRLYFMGSGFKRAMMTAALDLPGTKKAVIGRLVWVVEDAVPIYGIPQLRMDVVRSADINRTPDIRTRAILPEWGTVMTVRFVSPRLNQTAIVNLALAAGVTVGVGDYRQEKGGSNYGQFRIVDPEDRDYQRVVKNGGRKAQDAALASPDFFNLESRELFNWYTDEVAKKTRHDGTTTIGPKKSGRAAVALLKSNGGDEHEQPSNT